MAQENAQCFEAEVVALDKDITVRILQPSATKQPTSCVRVLAFALLKGSHNDQIVRQSCELGVNHLVAYPAERSVVQIKSESDALGKLERWQKIAESAARQAQQSQIATVTVVPSLAACLEVMRRTCGPDEPLLFGALLPGTKEMRELPAPKNKVAILIGPEGDFSAEEFQLLQKNELLPFSLGPMRLRAETAAFCALAAAHALWGFRL